MAIPDRRRARVADVGAFVGELYGADLHAKRVESLAGATLGVMQSASLAVAVIGQALAQARGLVTKHAIKQVDRMLSNNGINVWDSFARWVAHQIGERRDILVAMDWTDFNHDDRATLALNMVTGHGRAAPLLWLSVWKDELTKQRNDFEDACLRRLGLCCTEAGLESARAQFPQRHLLFKQYEHSSGVQTPASGSGLKQR